MRKLRLLLWSLLSVMAFGLGASGCLISRTIVAVKDHPTKPLMLMETRDYYAMPLFHLGDATVRQFWRCGDDGKSTVTCSKSCGTNDLACSLID